MTARSEILEAAHALTARGLAPFSPMDLLHELHRSGTEYPDSTLRSHIVSSMCVQAPQGYWKDLDRVDRGQYRLADTAGTTGKHGRGRAGRPATPGSGPVESSRPWSWEGHVQAALVTHLAAEGWSIVRVADTESRESGVDVVAERDDERLLIEVKGFPTKVYARGERAGEVKPSGQVPTQARHWFASVVLQGLLVAADEPEARAVIALPENVTYVNLTKRISGVLSRAGVEVWLVDEDGTVRVHGP